MKDAYTLSVSTAKQSILIILPTTIATEDPRSLPISKLRELERNSDVGGGGEGGGYKSCHPSALDLEGEHSPL